VLPAQQRDGKLHERAIAKRDLYHVMDAAAQRFP
jgi:hypothetical protein